MNRLSGKILAVESSLQMSMVDVQVGADTFSVIILDTPQTAPCLVKGHSVELVFKETEVAIAKDLSGHISLRNRMNAIVQDVQTQGILSKIVLSYQNQEITSVITARSAKQMMLKPGDRVQGLVKANEISIQGIHP